MTAAGIIFYFAALGRLRHFFRDLPLRLGHPALSLGMCPLDIGANFLLTGPRLLRTLHGGAPLGLCFGSAF